MSELQVTLAIAIPMIPIAFFLCLVIYDYWRKAKAEFEANAALTAFIDLPDYQPPDDDTHETTAQHKKNKEL